MKIGLIITKGEYEHPCIKEDDGRCSRICPNYCTPDGYPYKEAITLGLQVGQVTCALGCEGLTLDELT